jgi:Fur family iron response transcriptional regulator
MSVSRSLRREFAASDEVVFRSPGDIARKLREVGVRPTNQRVALVSILVRESGHTTAKGLHETAVKSRIAVSLATVYNTLHHLTKHRLLRPTSVDTAFSVDAN